MTGPVRPGGGPARPSPPPVAAPAPGPVLPPTPQEGNGIARTSPVAPPATAPGPQPPQQTRPAGPVAAPAASSEGIRRGKVVRESIQLDPLLQHLVRMDGSDLHLVAGAPPTVRINGVMTQVPGYPVVTPEMLQEALFEIVSEEQRQHFIAKKELDFAYMVPGIARFRGNYHKQRGSYAAVFRVVPWEIKPLESLGMPAVVNNFAALPRGLVLVTGQTGSGKSTTLASLLDRANKTRSGHIVTIEDPVEFLHNHRGCLVTQREVGNDTDSYAEALKHVLRQDPDIILIGELRDHETISIALTAAETGHLVLSTLHTQSAQDTVNRIIDVFTSDAQPQIRAQLAGTLKGVVCQTLVETADKRSRVAAVEIMVVNSAIATMIRRGETHQIPQALQSGGREGMQTLNQHLAQLVLDGKITQDTAEKWATDIRDLDGLIAGGKTSPTARSSASRQDLARALESGGLNDFGL